LNTFCKYRAEITKSDQFGQCGIFRDCFGVLGREFIVREVASILNTGARGWRAENAQTNYSCEPMIAGPVANVDIAHFQASNLTHAQATLQ
jgi:hypothetical protein